MTTTWPHPTGGRSGGWCAAWLADWNAFWFTASDPLPLGVVRIATGAILAWSAFVWLLDAPAFFGPVAWLRAEDVWRMNDQPWQWSWFFAAPEAATLLTIATLVAAVCLTLGLATPLAAIVSLAGLVSAANRAPLNTFGLDDTLGMLLVPLVVGPAGAVLSLDSLLGHRSPQPSVRANIALRLLQVHLCVVYLFSGCGKLLGASWWEGTALWGAIANGQYRTLDLTGLARHPLVVNALTLGTLWWEVGYAALVWPRRTRPLVLAMAVPVHLGIGLAMGMMEFGLAMLVANLAFVPAETFRSLAFRSSTTSERIA
ncbi:MAG: HTTM domain-containing protein [Planctomycetia bacterium]|nr:HTTM domain-containing protein [Planctomycetia bacterium]